MRKLFALAALSMAAIAPTVHAQYLQNVYLEPIPVWNLSGFTYEIKEEAILEKIATIEGNSTSTVVDVWDCDDWDVFGCSWSYNKKFFPIMFQLSPPSSSIVGMATSIWCPTGSQAYFYQHPTLPRRWDTCKIQIPTSVNPGAQPNPSNPFNTGVDWSTTGMCYDRQIKINGQIVTRCFNEMSVF